jgi:D-xylose transport system substrate-binding protein
MRKTLGAIAGASAIALLLAGCGGSSDKTPSSSGPSSSTTTGATAGKVGVILPDATTSPRWEANDRPLLDAAFKAAGISADIQNANKDKTKFGTICDSLINESVNVLLITNLDSDSGSACLKKAQAAGIKTIDYDRLTLGGGASYYVSFDNAAVGGLMATGIEKCLTDAGKTKANLILIDGDPTDNNALLFKNGYIAGLKAKVNSGDYKIVGEQTGKWDKNVAGTTFQQLFTDAKGKVDGVVSANDTMAEGIIARLKANSLAGKVPVTGQDASVPGLQNILAGYQCMTVYKAIKLEAGAAAELAIDLIQGKDASALAKDKVNDSVLKVDVPSVLLTPVAIYKDTVKTVIDDGYQTAADVCVAEFKAACTAASIS